MPKSKEKRQKNNDHENKKKDYWPLVELFSIFFALGLILYIWAIYPDELQKIDKQNTPITVPFNKKYSDDLPYDEKKSYAQKIGEKYGTYGDTYGSLNTLFSGWAFALLLISLFMQRKELQEQRKELAAQRDEISKSNEIAESQREITNQQAELLKLQVKDSQIKNFYELFFKYLEIKEKKIISLKMFKSTQTYTDVQCFALFSRAFINNCKEIYLRKPSDNDFNKLRMYYESSLSNAFYNFEYETRFPFKRSMYLDYISFIINFIESNSELINTKDVVKILLSNFNEDEIYSLLWMGIKNETIYNFNKKYQIQLIINYEIPISTIDALYYIYEMEDFIQHGIEYKHEG